MKRFLEAVLLRRAEEQADSAFAKTSCRTCGCKLQSGKSQCYRCWYRENPKTQRRLTRLTHHAERRNAS